MRLMTIVLLIFFFPLAAFAAPEKTLYKCRIADGSIAFTETPCQGERIATIPIDPSAKAKQAALKEPSCQALAKEIWLLQGQVDHTEFGAAPKETLKNKTRQFKAACNATLERSELAMECAVLGKAARLIGADDQSDASARIKAQHATQCNAAAVAGDIAKHALAASNVAQESDN